MDAHAKPPYLACMTIFLCLVIATATTTAQEERNFSPTVKGSRRVEMAKTRNDISSSEKGDRPVHTFPTRAKKRGFNGVRACRTSPLAWQERIFNGSEHEVPSGANPISNK